ncbi:hypothetical protein HDV63DRAFT_366520 [Trichoderma sp. SZMC 28014]
MTQMPLFAAACTAAFQLSSAVTVILVPEKSRLPGDRRLVIKRKPGTGTSLEIRVNVMLVVDLETLLRRSWK